MSQRVGTVTSLIEAWWVWSRRDQQQLSALLLQVLAEFKRPTMVLTARWTHLLCVFGIFVISHPNGLILQTDVVCVCEVNTFNTLCGVSAKTHRERSAHMYSGATPSVDLLIWHIVNTRAAASTPSAPTESPRHLHNLQSGMFVIMITTRPHAGINISDGNVHTRSLQTGSYVI